ncbi:MAG: protein kinase [Planctomycetes bacterium]|nr:protein kinase [Planctomycetota bacterium]
MNHESAADPVEDLLEQCLDRPAGEWTKALDSLCEAHPSHASALRKRYEALRSAGLLQELSPQGDFPSELGPFRLKQRLGGGGMGVVYLAEDAQLQREVALKLIRPEHLFFEGSRRRFRREIEAVARLQHPGIVSIYSVGEERGVPYFAMERVRGATLAEVLSEVGAVDPSTLKARDFAAALARRAGLPEPSPEVVQRAFGTTWIDAVLHVVRSLAEALEHAHERGVLHRDVKPSNAMATPDGRVLLVDFGLAQAEGTEQLTRTGSTLGSLAYMPPEQVRGEHRTLGPRADIYSLGATLYELLSLRLPFAESDGEALRRMILQGEVAPLTRWNRAVSWELDTVCRQALEPDPERRYASAGALARDLTRILEHKPIEARRAGPWLRATRWAQRHPASTVAILLTALAAPSIFAVQQRGERLAAEQRAGQALRSALFSINTLHERVAELPGGKEVANDFVRDALKTIEALEAQGALESSELARAVAFAKLRLGDAELERSSGEPARLQSARAHFEAASARFEERLRANDADRDARRGLAACSERLAVVAAREGRNEEARRFAERSASERARVLASAPDDLAAAREALAGEQRVAEAFANAGRYDEAIAQLEHCCAELDELLARAPENATVQRDLSGALASLGRARIASGEKALAGPPFTRALELDRALVSRDAHHVEHRRKRAEQARDLGLLQVELERVPEGQALLEEAYAAYRALLLDEPLDAIARYGYARTALDLGLIVGAQRARQLSGEVNPAAHALFAEALAIGRGLHGEPASALADALRDALLERARFLGQSQPSRFANLALDLAWETRELVPLGKRARGDVDRLEVTKIVRAGAARNDVAAYELAKTCFRHAERARAAEPAVARELFALGAEFFRGSGDELVPPAERAHEFFAQGWSGMNALGELYLAEDGNTSGAREWLTRAERFAERAAEQASPRAEFLAAARTSALHLARLAVREGDAAGAREHGQRALARADACASAPDASARDLNGCAWTLLEIVPEDLRDPQRALELATRAEKASRTPEAEVLDTLARALFACDRAAEAVRAQERAIERLRSEADRPDQLRRLQEMHDQLARYRAG